MLELWGAYYAGQAVVLWLRAKLTPREPCNECGRGMWRWRAYLIINDGTRQIQFRPFKWRWFDMWDRVDKLSGYRKIYSRWVLRGPFEYRTARFSSPDPAPHARRKQTR